MSGKLTPLQKSPPAKAPDSSAGPGWQAGQSLTLPPGYLQYYGIQRKADPAAREPEAEVQLKGDGEPVLTDSQVHAAAAEGVAGAGAGLPHLQQIQQSFGPHDVSGVQAHVGGPATTAADAIGATAYATGDHVAFAHQPDLHTSAHEAAHVVQQRAGVHLQGGIGAVGDPYEQHADAVADRVVAGRGAADLLDQMAPAGAGTGGVQKKVLQLDIKSDLRDAMRGWGSGEDRIFARIQRASVDELHAVVADRTLMNELTSDLSRSAMGRVMDMVNAPLPDRLRLAMRGWGHDENYMFQSVARAPLAEVTALAQDRTLQGQIDDELSGADGNRIRAQIARRIFVEGGATQAEWAFFMLQGLHVDDRALAARMALFGSIVEVRTLCDDVVTNFTDVQRVRQAFKTYWGVEISAQDGARMSDWPIPVLKAMHAQLKNIPDQDTRSGFWRQLSLSNASLMDHGVDVGLRNRAAYNDQQGNFIVGTQASATSVVTMGYNTTLTAQADPPATTIQVQDGARLQVGASITIGGATSETKTIRSISGNTWTLDSALAQAHASGANVAPADNSASRNINWLAATVRHEIGHSVYAALGSKAREYDALGGWWASSPGSDFDLWANTMGSPWSSTGTALTDDDKKKIKDAIVDAVSNRKGSLYGTGMNLDATHPVKVHQNDNVPVILAAEACLLRGDDFRNHPYALYKAGGKVFTTNYYYREFMYFDEQAMHQRVSDYSLYAPLEFFAEAYTIFYEDRGLPGITEDRLGERIRNTTWRDWIRNNVHNRGHAPGGSGT